jgi:RNA polymerase sigma-70 factor (ECF subfamily)
MQEKGTKSDADSLLWDISMHDDKCAFRSLFELYYAPLCLYAKRFVADKSVREDIVQDVFFSVWGKRKWITSTVSAQSYLISCVKNNSLNYLRKQHYFQEYQDKQIENPPVYEENPDSLYNLHELQQLLSKALKKLPNEYRLAFVMSRFEGKSATEIAEVMQVSVRTVERYRNKAIEILKNELKNYLPFLLFILLKSTH